MRKYREYSDNDIINYSKEVTSIAGLLKKLGLVPAGGSYGNIKKLLFKLKVDTSHWTGQSWNKNKQLKNWNEYTRCSSVRYNLIKSRGLVCEQCLNITWNDLPIPIELHHIDGNNLNNKIENLKLLCCNCHAQTSSWRRTKK